MFNHLNNPDLPGINNSILSYLAKELLKSKCDNCAIYADFPGHTITGGTIPSNILPTSQHPDLVLNNNDDKSVIYLSSPFYLNPTRKLAKGIKCFKLK